MSTAINPENYIELSENTIKAIKTANHVNFYFEPSKDDQKYDRSEMTIYPTSDHKEYLKVDTKSQIEGTWSPSKDWLKCWGNTSHYCHEFVTFKNYLRKGDKIRLVYQPDHGTNGYVRAAGLHCDYLMCEVVRGEKITRFILDVSICPNNSARMLHPTEDKKQRDKSSMKQERERFDHWYDMGLDRPKDDIAV